MIGSGSLIYSPASHELPPPADEIGGKAHHLARLAAVTREAGPGVSVPTWIVVQACAFNRIVVDGQTPPATTAEAAQRQAEIRATALPVELREEVLAALAGAGLREARLAIRSSAVDEDGAAASFAGQFDSVLGVKMGPDDTALWDALRRVWASAFNAHAAAYRQRHGDQAAAGPRMAVILQEMVDAAVSGVAFSADPVCGDRDTAVVSAVYGLGEGLVSGELDADTYRVRFVDSRPAGVQREIVRKNRAVRMAPEGGTRLEPVPAPLSDQPALTDEEAQQIAASARRLAQTFGGPQDVEWALAEPKEGMRRLFLLQTRAITTLPDAEGAGGEARLWDNSNIVESYSGVTTPLTFSFARGVYEEVYRQFCRLMGVSEPLVEQHRHVFANMLGLVRGRIYYNLLNWYRALALLPGFSYNRAFMERMMGVSQKLENPPEPPRTAGRWTDLFRLVRMVLRMSRECGRLKTEVPRFHARVEAALSPWAREDLIAWPADDLAALYRRLESELLRHWRAPLVNDFFAMIFFGVLCRLIEKWLPDAPPALANDLLCGEGGIISTEPARRVMALARQVAGSPGLTDLFAAEPDDRKLWAKVETEPEHAGFYRDIGTYLDRFGDRCMNELKLETVTLGEDPTFLLQMIRAYAAQGTVDPEAARAREVTVRREAEGAVRARLGTLRRPIFMSVLRQARRRVRDRENLRFERTRVFGLVRRIFLALGERLAPDRLAAPRDVFYLTKQEIFAYLDGTAVTTDLKTLVSLRRAEFAAYETAPAPPDRFETSGPPAETRAACPAPPAAETPPASLKGMGCCPGVVRAPVRVVRDPHEARDLTGHILVAERTDPGWTLLFPAARGLLVQRGSLLSHSAIVAREIGLPCIVGVPRLLETLREGEWVEMDGTTGIVRRLDGAIPGEG
jgi:pyruvate,water dikinase